MFGGLESWVRGFLGFRVLSICSPLQLFPVRVLVQAATLAWQLVPTSRVAVVVPAKTTTANISAKVPRARRGMQGVLMGLDPSLTEKSLLRSLREVFALLYASGHTATNTPDLFRTPKLTVAGPGQYWGGGPPGKSFGCC